MATEQTLANNQAEVHSISVVIPVYNGAGSLPQLMQEIDELASQDVSPDGHLFKLVEVVLVYDCGPEASVSYLEELAKRYNYVSIIWLSKNYGQHPATLAGLSSTIGQWVVTLDEDGQQNPADIPKFLDTALTTNAQLVYARPANRPPHSFLRNLTSKSAKLIADKFLGQEQFRNVNSFRMIQGEVARTLSAYSSAGVYLDIGLFWMVQNVQTCTVALRIEYQQASGYSYKKLLKHFWQLVLTTGTKPLRAITLVGVLSIILAIGISIYAIYSKITMGVDVPGWTSLIVTIAFFSGVILTALGIIAEYLAVSLGIVMGKPLYVISSKPVTQLKTDNES